MAKLDDLLYEAEAQARIDLLGALASIEDANRYVRHVLGTPWWKELCGNAEYRIEARYIPRWQYCWCKREPNGLFVAGLTLARLHEGVLLHELAHIPSYAVDSDMAKGRRDHGPAFIRAQLTILEGMVNRYYIGQYELALKSRGFVW